MEYVKKYVNRQPRIGDMVESIANPFRYGDHEIGHEYEVVRLGSGYIEVTGNRMPAARKTILINDKHYQIFELVEYIVAYPKETHIKEYKFLGITLLKRKTLVFDGQV